MRYLISDGERFERGSWRFVYDTRYERFTKVERKIGSEWETIKLASPDFYRYFPGHAAKLRESETEDFQ